MLEVGVFTVYRSQCGGCLAVPVRSAVRPNTRRVRGASLWPVRVSLSEEV